MIEPLLLTTTQITTLAGGQTLSNASGFFFARDSRLFLVTSRHVVRDDPSGHHPDTIEIELHTDAANLALATGFRIPLYGNGSPLWRQAVDSAGEVDVAAIEIDQPALPRSTVYAAFSPEHLQRVGEQHVEIGSSLLVVGFPLGFHDTLHHLPVARHAIVASSFGLRFQGNGYFLTDARTHRGTSGAAVVMHDAAVSDVSLPWKLLGIHSARLDVSARDSGVDEALGLNCAWFADILLTLTLN